MPPITLKVSSVGLAAEALVLGFFGVVLLLIGLIMGAWPIFGAAAALLMICGLRLQFRRQEAVIVERNQVTVQTAFSKTSYPYEGMDALIRRSVSMTRRSHANPLAGTALALRKKGQILVRVPVSWSVEPEALRQAVAWIEQLPIPRRYI